MRATTCLTLGSAALLAVTGLTGCGSEDDPSLAAPTTAAVQPTGAAPTGSAPTGAASTGAAPADGPAPGSTLLALVGTKDEPESFEISLTDSTGAPVTQLAAGSYTIKVTDQSRIHNFALKGDGVEMATDVGDKENPTWQVTFKPGDYTYTCDPHPSMSGSFVVA